MEFATGSDSEEGSEEQDMVAPMKDLGISPPKRKKRLSTMMDSQVRKPAHNLLGRRDGGAGVG